MRKLKQIMKMIGKGILILLGILFLILIGMTIYNTILTVNDNKLLADVGQDVTVEGKNMRIDIQGAGEHTIVLLPGLGTYSPIEDFKPLASRLAESNQVDYESEMQVAEWFYYPSRALDITGLTRMQLKDDGMLKAMTDSGYSAEELKIIKAVKARRAASRALIHENNSIPENLGSLKDMKYPENLPVLTFLADDTIQKSDEMFAEKGFDITWEKLHTDLITNNQLQQIEILTGEHYLHWTNAELMAEKMMQFIGQMDSSSAQY